MRAWEAAQEAGEITSFVNASSLGVEVLRLDAAGNVVEIFSTQLDS